MSLGRKPGDPEVRDIEGDYIKAYLEEHANYIRAGLRDRANAVAVTLRQLGHEIDKAPPEGKSAPSPVPRWSRLSNPPSGAVAPLKPPNK